jgi:serine/arginine repetitive matrix protein 2
LSNDVDNVVCEKKSSSSLLASPVRSDGQLNRSFRFGGLPRSQSLTSLVKDYKQALPKSPESKDGLIPALMLVLARQEIDLFDEVRRGFEFSDERPVFYPPPAVTRRVPHRKHESTLSIRTCFQCWFTQSY